MNKKYKYRVSFPHIGNYYIPIYNWLYNIFDKETTKIMIPKKITNRTLELGSNNSPDFICVPFKYNLGNFIESLDDGANVIIQGGGGCKYGYYAEVQKQILIDMGYNFKYITLVEKDKIKPISIYMKFKELNPKLTFIHFAYRFIIAALIGYFLDKFENYMRENISFEVKKGEFNILHMRFIERLKNVKKLSELFKLKRTYFNKLKNIKLISLEQIASNNIEKELASLGASTKRYTTMTYLLVKKPLEMKSLIKKSSKYIEYELGADGTTSIAHALELANNGYDGIIHIKPFGCTPEENAIPILEKISDDKNIA